jgi:VanZ family protein
MTLRPFKSPRLWLGIWLFGWVLCIALSLSPPIPLDGPPDSDKIGHLIAYFTLSAWAMQVFATRRAQAVAALALFVLGLSMEIGQATLTTTRMGDPADLLANTIGIVLGFATAFTPLATLLLRLEKAKTGS